MSAAPTLPAPLAILDGATGTELARRGVNTDLPLWSAAAIDTAPDLLLAVHRAYLRAGCDLVTANTFRTTERTFARAGRRDDAARFARRAVELARAARDEVNPAALVLGSVAPLEDCYRPDLSPDAESCHREHAQLIDRLLAAGADIILIETMNALGEACAAARAAEALAPGRWMISFCMHPDGPGGTLLSGESIEPLPTALASALALGVNCVAAPDLEPHVTVLRRVAPDRRLLASANVGRPDDRRGWISTDAVTPQRYAEYAASWVAAGADIIGGCCGTTPATIAALKAWSSRSTDRCPTESPSQR